MGCLVACSEGSGASSAAATSGVSTTSIGAGGGVGGAAGTGGNPADGQGGGGGGEAPFILSSFYGLDDALPPTATTLCLGAAGEDGMPVVLRLPLPDDTIDESVFMVETTGDTATSILCATLAPATDGTELRTVLLVGEFGSAPADEPTRVTIVDSLLAADGTDLVGATFDMVTPLAAGPQLVVAERFGPNVPASACPPGALQAVQMTWQGGVTAADGEPLGDAARLAVTVHVDDGDGTTAAVLPSSLTDLDNDNYVIACLDDDRPAVRIEVEAGEFFDPGNDPNPATAVDIAAPPPF